MGCGVSRNGGALYVVFPDELRFGSATFAAEYACAARSSLYSRGRRFSWETGSKKFSDQRSANAIIQRLIMR